MHIAFDIFIGIVTVVCAVMMIQGLRALPLAFRVHLYTCLLIICAVYGWRIWHAADDKSAYIASARSADVGFLCWYSRPGGLTPDERRAIISQGYLLPPARDYLEH